MTGPPDGRINMPVFVPVVLGGSKAAGSGERAWLDESAIQ